MRSVSRRSNEDGPVCQEQAVTLASSIDIQAPIFRRLALCHQAWQDMGASQWALSILSQGYKIQFDKVLRPMFHGTVMPAWVNRKHAQMEPALRQSLDSQILD